MQSRNSLVPTWLKNLFATEGRRPRRSFVPSAEGCELRDLKSGLAIVADLTTVSQTASLTVPPAVIAPVATTPELTADDDAPPTDPTNPTDPPPVPVPPLLGTVSWG